MSAAAAIPLLRRAEKSGGEGGKQWLRVNVLLSSLSAVLGLTDRTARAHTLNLAEYSILRFFFLSFLVLHGSIFVVSLKFHLVSRCPYALSTLERIDRSTHAIADEIFELPLLILMFFVRETARGKIIGCITCFSGSVPSRRRVNVLFHQPVNSHLHGRLQRRTSAAANEDDRKMREAVGSANAFSL